MAYVLHTTLLLEGFFIVVKPRPWFAVTSVGFLPCICSEPLNLEKKCQGVVYAMMIQGK